MKHVIFVIHTLAVGGAERYVSSMANYLVHQGLRVTIVLIDDAKVDFTVDDRVHIVCVNQSIKNVPADNRSACELFRATSEKSLSVWEKLKLKIARGSQKAMLELEIFLRQQYAAPLKDYLKTFPDAVVASCMTIPNLSTMMALEKLPNKALFSDRTSPQTEYPADSPHVRLKHRYYQRAQAAVFQTPEAAEYYTWLPSLKKVLIPNFIKGELLPDRFTGQRRKDIVNFCRLHPVKNIPLLIGAFERLYREYPDYTLSIYGEGAVRPELEALVKEKALDGAVRFYDFDSRIHETVRDAAMFVSSSDREGISNSMLEAMAIGLPTICTDCPAGGARMTIEDGVNGLLTPVGDEDALYQAMKRLVEDTSFADTLSKNAVKIKEDLTLERIGQLWIDALHLV